MLGWEQRKTYVRRLRHLLFRATRRPPVVAESFISAIHLRHVLRRVGLQIAEDFGEEAGVFVHAQHL